jgi:hypothetical protein
MPTPRAGYFLKDGTRVPGVTTILGRWKESGGLLQWAFQQGRNGAASLYDERDAAATIGTMAHAMCDACMRETSPADALETFRPTAEQADKAHTALRAFGTWRGNYVSACESAETPLVSELHRFGGTPDFVIRQKDGLLAMADLKTSNGIYRDYLMQVAAYGLVWNENHPDDPITGGFHILRLGKESPDFEHRYYPELDGAAELFLLLRKAYDLDAVLKKRCG